MNLPQIKQKLPSFKSVTFIGQRVTAERTPDSVTGFCVTGWEDGLPVTKRLITGSALMELLQRYPHTLY
jgi:uncharacterized protein YmfQ (DUF2313 family)